MTKNTLVKALFTGAAFLFLNTINAQTTSTWDWAKTSFIAGDEWQDASAATTATDADGNIYVSCNSNAASITFDGQTFTNSLPENSKFYLSKYDSGGNLLWVKNNATDDKSYIGALTTDAEGNIYALGNYANTISFGNITLTNNDIMKYNMFLTKFDSNGNVVWVKEGIPANGSFNAISPSAITLDANGNIYITGNASGALATFGNVALTIIGQSNAFIVKYDANGNALWGKNGNGQIFAFSNVVTDSSGNVYLTGSYQSPTMIFNDITFTNLGHISSYVIKYDSIGNALWSKSFSQAPNSITTASLVIDSQDNIYLGGYFSTLSLSIDDIVLTNEHLGEADIFITRFDTDGHAVWAKSIGGELSDFVSDLVTDNDGNIYMTGSFRSPEIQIGEQTIVNEGPDEETTNSFLAKFDSNGEPYHAELIGGTGLSQARSIALGTGDDIFIAGDYYENITFGEIALNSPHFNMFLAKLSLDTSLSQNEFEHSVNSIYPNPATTVLNIKTDKPVSTYSIFDLTGRIVNSGKLNNGTAINISHLPSGLYILSYDNGINTKFVKE